jgi:aspartyl/glutamyl-tRNA(Asn/Gln) amidotransferase C subunit
MKFTSAFTKQIADLAKLQLDSKQAAGLAAGFSECMDVVEQLVALDTEGVAPTYQVNNLENVLRPDQVEPTQMFSQKQALANAKRTYQGYFVVERLIDHEP